MIKASEIVAGLLGLAFPFLIVSIFVFGVGIGFGYLFHWIFKIELGSSFISGFIAAGLCLHFGLRLNKSLDEIEKMKLLASELGEDEIYDDDSITIYAPPPSATRKRRKRR